MSIKLRGIIGRASVILCAVVFAMGIAAVPKTDVKAFDGPWEGPIKPGDVVNINEDYSSYWFQLTVDKVGRYTIESEGDEDPKVVLYASNKEDAMASADAGGKNRNFRLSSILAKGTYWYRVSQASGRLYDTTVKMTANTDDTVLARIDSTDIPDDIFRNYIDTNYDTINDNMIRVYETSDEYFLNLSDKAITSLKGLNCFPELSILYVANTDITSLDLSANPKLADLSCSNTNIESLDLSKHTELTEIACNNTKLKSLNLSNNVKLTEVMCYNNPDLETLTLGKNERLEFLHVYNNKIDTLDVTGCIGLSDLKCYGNNMSNLYIKGLKRLSLVNCSDNLLSELDLTDCAISTLICSGNHLAKLDPSGMDDLRGLNVSNNDILKQLNLSGCSHLRSLDASSTIKLKTLDIGDCPYLVTVYNKTLYWDDIEKAYTGTILDKECFFKIDEDNISVNKGTVDYSEIVVKIDSTNFPDAQFRKFVKEYLDDNDDGNLSRLEIINATSVTVLNKNISDLKGIEYLTDLTYLNVSSNSLTSMDLSKNTKLVTLVCDNNQLRSLDTSNNARLVNLYCFNNKLTSLDLSKNPSLKILQCQQNSLGKLDISSNENLLKAFTEGSKSDENGVCKRIYRSTYYLYFDDTTEIITVKPTATPTAKPTDAPKATATEAPKAPVTTAPADSVKLTLNKETANLVCGKTLTLKATLTGSNASITWKSSDTKIATVSNSGKITAKMAGQVTITATAAGKSAKCIVQVQFKDVTSSKDFWYAPTYYLANKNVVKGYDKQTKFKPANKCTRAQMVTFIWRLQGEPDPKTKTCKFKDVKKSDYFYKACIWGNEKGIVEGYKDGTFGPQIVCARKHAVTFLWRLANKPAPKSTKNKFKDVKKSDYFYKATLWASEKKILAGYSETPDGHFLI